MKTEERNGGGGHERQYAAKETKSAGTREKGEDTERSEWRGVGVREKVREVSVGGRRTTCEEGIKESDGRPREDGGRRTDRDAKLAVGKRNG
jgi:hypothetical protein